MENLGLSPCATQELLEQLYSKSLTPELAKLVAQQTIKSWINDPQLAAEYKSLFYNLGIHCDKSLYLEALKPTYILTPVLIAEGHYKELYIEIEARNRLNIPRYHIDDSSLKQLAALPHSIFHHLLYIVIVLNQMKQIDGFKKLSYCKIIFQIYDSNYVLL